jgi:hypothetical protein
MSSKTVAAFRRSQTLCCFNAVKLIGALQFCNIALNLFSLSIPTLHPLATSRSFLTVFLAARLVSTFLLTVRLVPTFIFSIGSPDQLLSPEEVLVGVLSALILEVMVGALSALILGRPT